MSANLCKGNSHGRESRLTHTIGGTPHRAAVERFIADVFGARYNALLERFPSNLVSLERQTRIVAAAGWRSAGAESLFLEAYLDEPAEAAISRVAGAPVARHEIVEVAHLASVRPGAGTELIPELACFLHALGFSWVIFTATRELRELLARIGLPQLALVAAEPARLGADAAAWGSYYDTTPLVVAGPIRLALGMHRHDG